jgi:hypothetical protein
VKRPDVAATDESAWAGIVVNTAQVANALSATVVLSRQLTQFRTGLASGREADMTIPFVGKWR